MPTKNHNLLLNRAFQYLGIILIMAALGGGYWYWKQAQAGANIKAPSNSGLKAYWKFDETAGTSATDSSGNNNTGTLQSSPSRVEGKKNKAITFNGSNQYVSVPDSTSINIGTAVTVSAWVKGDSWADGDTNAVYIKYLSHYVTVNTSGNVGVYGYGKSPVGYHHSNQALKTGIWYNIAVTIDASEFRIYIDGKLDKTVSATGTLSTSAGQAAAIGAEPGGGSRYFNGSIDEVRIYNRALPMEEIASSYAETKIDYSFENSLEQGLVGYWKLDDASGTSAADSSGNGNTGTLTSGPTWTTGQIGGATDFDGTDDHIVTNDINALDGLSFLTVGAWANIDALTQDKTIFSKSNSSADGNRIQMALGGTGYGEPNDITLSIGDASNQYAYTTGDIVSTGVWNHYVMVFDGTQTGNANRLKLYKNGTQQALTFGGGVTIPATTSASNAGIFQIGAETNHVTSNRYWDGSIDEIRVYNRPLGADEVAKLYRTTAPDDPDTGLVGYWPFNGSDISGTTAYDRSGKGGNGTLTNGPTKTIGKIGQAFSFNGTNQYASLGINKFGPILNGRSQVTVSAWVNPSAYPADAARKRILSILTNDTSAGVLLNIYDDSGLIEMGGRSSTGDSFQTASVAYPALNEWHFVTGILDFPNDKIYLYLDGVLRVTQSVTFANASYTNGTPTTLTDSIGSLSTTGEYFSGKIDEPRIYNRALSASEIWNLYQAGAADKMNSADSQIDSLEKGMVGYWKLDDASGTSASDASGNANTGTLTNGPTWTTGQIGGATSFDGTDDYITVPDGNSLDLTSDMTISVWANADNWTGEGNISTLVKKDLNYILRKDADAGTGGSGLKLLWWDGTNLLAQRVSTLPTTGAWHHIVGVIESNSTRKIYVDGALQSGTDYSSAQARVLTANLSIGNHQSAGTESFDGKMDEVRIYNRALSADEVVKLYKTTMPDDPDTGLVGYWPFNGPDIAGTTAYDRSGKGNTGTLTNGPTRAIGKIGQGMSFDGSDDYVALGTTSTAFNFANNLSASAWIKTATNGKLILEYQNSTPLVYMSVGPTTAGGTANKFVVYLRTNSGSVAVFSSAQSVTDNAWHHVAFTRDTAAQKVRFYIDGSFDSEISYTDTGAIDTSGASSHRIGGTGSYYFNGSIDEVRVFNRALTQTEITALYNAGR
ncbi:MAG: LamG domain-containing protein [Candidatus Moranbacteria bacterium]|nr:LamG domain-containing protein [Candidatus Moranbacteria bacterium]